MILKGERNEFPHKDEIATYLEEYARHFQLPIQLQTEVLKIRKEKEIFELHTPTEILQSKKLLSHRVGFINHLSLQFQKIFHRMFFKYIHHNINHHHKFLRGKYS